MQKNPDSLGKIFKNKVNDNLWLITGMSKEGIKETGPIVKDVKERAIEFSKKIGADYLIIDTSPGTHCNVIQALLDCDKVYAVTEPTPLGAHDLDLILTLLERLSIRRYVIVNRSGIGPEDDINKIYPSFNSKMVRLRVAQALSLILLLLCFNSKMVRLRADS